MAEYIPINGNGIMGDAVQSKPKNNSHPILDLLINDND